MQAGGEKKQTDMSVRKEGGELNIVQIRCVKRSFRGVLLSTQITENHKPDQDFSQFASDRAPIDPPNDLKFNCVHPWLKLFCESPWFKPCQKLVLC